jgi:hypothetical protein
VPVIDRSREDSVADNGEHERYKRALDDVFQQLDWCIGYLHGIRKTEIASVLSKNRSYIKEQLLHQPDEAMPSSTTDE